MTNPLSRSRLEAAFNEESSWIEHLEGDAKRHAETVIATLSFLLNPEVTKAMRIEADKCAPDAMKFRTVTLNEAFKAMISKLTEDV